MPYTVKCSLYIGIRPNNHHMVNVIIFFISTLDNFPSDDVTTFKLYKVLTESHKEALA